MTGAPLINVTDACYTIGSRTLWRGLNLEVEPAEMVAITGPSGAGKTTLLNCIGLIDRFTAGRLSILNRDLSAPKESVARRFRRQELGYLFQDFALVEADSVIDNVRLALPPGTSRRDAVEKIRAALDVVGLSEKRRNIEKSKVYELSGGEQQRVALARLIVRNPRIILADEPTASLDRENGEMTLRLMRLRAEAGAAVVVVSHDPWVVDHCDREFRIAMEEN
ncbi:ABC transporter ATP-binding protein [Corynebacterium liangguodongii]|uniref:Lipoprotein ABC transporter ATP-binding protein n=1 Tax=Corynebacterium liangguodongii TaxID=2079535 RepID=A0A2S0WCG8_9CORY|nr:ABC transporter ATP-binding protein [Corynebacterium liangguodongii]AWB83465.1 lipoprotein ABC transporter ATP-binding protein [Corynebacterium liangguodongii]PWC00446.1 ABC transporter ATP-binding protein [Corynebacterium liangguodongii]